MSEKWIALVDSDVVMANSTSVQIITNLTKLKPANDLSKLKFQLDTSKSVQCARCVAC
mgnify:CR=1